MSIADKIRDYVYNQYVQPAVLRGDRSIRLRAGDVHKEMNFRQRMPLVCSAIGGNKFRGQYNLVLVNRTGPKQGANVYFEFRVASAIGPRDISVSRNSQKKAMVSNETVVPSAAKVASLTHAGAIYFVSCVGLKRDAPCFARDVYISDWFRKARQYVEQTGRPWFILSAKYGLVAPEQKIEPYDLTLNTMRVARRKEWADTVLRQMDKLLPATSQVVFLAGQRYREFLVGPLKDRGVKIIIPMEGLRIGEQLAWFAEQK